LALPEATCRLFNLNVERLSINKSAATSKAGLTPPRGTINSPEAERLLLKRKGR